MTTIRFPWPPSVNGYWRAIPRGKGVTQILSAEARTFRSKASMECLLRNAPKLGTARLVVTITMHAPDKRARDIDNHAKAVLDALTHAHVWDDDSQIDELHLIRGAVVPHDGHVIVEIAALDR
jgi:crossover junction endodeoxyribonuclease RusA